jgi:hypothetical protein
MYPTRHLYMITPPTATSPGWPQRGDPKFLCPLRRQESELAFTSKLPIKRLADNRCGNLLPPIRHVKEFFWM